MRAQCTARGTTWWFSAVSLRSAMAGRGLGWRDARSVVDGDGGQRRRDQSDGRSVNCRYTPRNRQEILESRVRPRALLAQAIAQARRPPRVWLQASTATIYAHRYDAPNDEASGLIGGDELDAPDTWKFSIDVARAWERAFSEAVAPQTRKVALRSAMTMSPDAWRHLRHPS